MSRRGRGDGGWTEAQFGLADQEMARHIRNMVEALRTIYEFDVDIA